MAFLVATTSLPAVYRPNGYAQTTTAGTPHARANSVSVLLDNVSLSSTVLYDNTFLVLWSQTLSDFTISNSEIFAHGSRLV